MELRVLAVKAMLRGLNNAETTLPIWLGNQPRLSTCRAWSRASFPQPRELEVVRKLRSRVHQRKLLTRVLLMKQLLSLATIIPAEKKGGWDRSIRGAER